MHDESLIPPTDMKWVAFGEGIEFSLLYTSEETGRWVVVFRCQPGSFFGPHRHLGAGEYYVVRGRMVYRIGEAGPGTYGYEPLDAVHDHTSFPEYTELLFINHGPVAFLDDRGDIATIVDHKMLRGLYEGA